MKDSKEHIQNLDNTITDWSYDSLNAFIKRVQLNVLTNPPIELTKTTATLKAEIFDLENEIL